MVDQRWTSDRALDRLTPLAESLHYWSEVYERWRRHPLAAVRPDQAPCSRAELAAVDDLRGVHFGQIAAAGQRWRLAGTAVTRLAGSAGATASRLDAVWRGVAAHGARQWCDQLQRDTQAVAEQCEAFGVQLEIAVIDTIAPVIASAVEEILARSRGFGQDGAGLPRQAWEQRIAELDQVAGRVDRVPLSEQYRSWCAELDRLVTDYDAVLGLFRATLTEAIATVRKVYHAMDRELAGWPPAPFGIGVPGGDHAGSGQSSAGPIPSTGLAPASTGLASAGALAGAGAPSAASSLGSGSGGGGGGGAVGESGAEGSAAEGSAASGSEPPGTGGPAVLGELGDSPPPGSGGAVLGSVSGDDPQRASRHWAAATPTGAPDGRPPEDRTPEDRPPDDRERAASWARLRALMGERN